MLSFDSMKSAENGKKIIVVCGATASGKSSLALQLAAEIDGEIVNADSMQVYQGLSIGTAKPSAEDQRRIRHHLLDCVLPDQPFSAADFVQHADAAIMDIIQRGKQAIVVGGTGLYIRALVKGLIDSPRGDDELRKVLHAEAEHYGNDAMLERLRQVDPELAATMHPNNLVRIVRALEVYMQSGVPLSQIQQEHGFGSRRYEALQIGIAVDRPQLYARIDERVEQMFAAGLLDEVKEVLAAGYTRELKSLRSIGYKEAAACLAGELSPEEAIRLIKRDTRRYAKRQLTWFKSDHDILWFEYPEKFVTIKKHVIEFLL